MHIGIILYILRFAEANKNAEYVSFDNFLSNTRNLFTWKIIYLKMVNFSHIPVCLKSLELIWALLQNRTHFISTISPRERVFYNSLWLTYIFLQRWKSEAQISRAGFNWNNHFVNRKNPHEIIFILWYP